MILVESEALLRDVILCFLEIVIGPRQKCIDFVFFCHSFQGALVSVCADDSLHLWNLRQKRPAILHSLKFNRER